MTYLGIDESNHGRFPEIFVGVFSRNPADLERTYQLPKRRKGDIKRNAFSALDGRDFRYVLIPREYKIHLGPHNLKIVAIAELIRSFVNLERVVIDGEFYEPWLKRLERVLKPKKFPETTGMAKADTCIPLVNLADGVANVLHKMYGRHKEQDVTEEYGDHIITPKLEDYLAKLRGESHLAGSRN